MFILSFHASLDEASAMLEHPHQSVHNGVVDQSLVPPTLHAVTFVMVAIKPAHSTGPCTETTPTCVRPTKFASWALRVHCYARVIIAIGR
eukprot:COSAG06_NODE_3141_length_5786_cov_31.010902_4_plen_90_part_00